MFTIIGAIILGTVFLSALKRDFGTAPAPVPSVHKPITNRISAKAYRLSRNV